MTFLFALFVVKFSMSGASFMPIHILLLKIVFPVFKKNRFMLKSVRLCNGH